MLSHPSLRASGPRVRHRRTRRRVPGGSKRSAPSGRARRLEQRFGDGARSYVIDDHVVIPSNDTTEALRAEGAKQYLRALSSDDGDTTQVDDTAWRFHWRT